MKRNIGICLLLCFALCFTAGCAEKVNEPSATENPQSPNLKENTAGELSGETADRLQLIVKGKYLTEVPYHIASDEAYPDNYAYIPFTATMRALGAAFDWQSDTTAKMKYNGETYIFDTENAILCKKGTDINLITPVSGGKMHYEGVGEDFAVDSNTFEGFFMLEHFAVRVIVNLDSKTVNVG